MHFVGGIFHQGNTIKFHGFNYYNKLVLHTMFQISTSACNELIHSVDVFVDVIGCLFDFCYCLSVV